MKIIVFAGWSAAGKKTTIRKILAGDQKLIDRFGVVGKVYATGYSFEPLIFDKLNESDTILLQWQVREHWKLAKVKEWFPEAEHKTIFLLRNWQEHTESHIKKYLDHRVSVQHVKDKTLWVLEKYFTNVGPIEMVKL